MYEYVFFHKVLAEKLITKVQSLKIQAQLVEDEPAWEVHIPEDIQDKSESIISDYYDELFEQDQNMYEQENSDEDAYGAAAIEFELKNGEKVYAQTNQELMGKILSVLNHEELNRFVGDIVFAVENPDERTICERNRIQK